MVARFVLIFLLSITGWRAANAQQAEVRQVLAAQLKAWNAGDLDGFMAGYWRNDSLQFVSPKGMTLGWQTVRDNYKRAYPDKAAMGQLAFDVLRVTALGPEAACMVGRWRVEQTEKPQSGYFTLIFRRIDGQWRIVSDHTS